MGTLGLLHECPLRAHCLTMAFGRLSAIVLAAILGVAAFDNTRFDNVCVLSTLALPAPPLTRIPRVRWPCKYPRAPSSIVYSRWSSAIGVRTPTAPTTLTSRIIRSLLRPTARYMATVPKSLRIAPADHTMHIGQCDRRLSRRLPEHFLRPRWHPIY